MTIITEEWAEIDGFPGYSVSTLGRVRKDSSGRLMRVRVNQYGVPYVGLMREWQQCIRSVPRLVAGMFIPQPNAVFNTPINKNGDRMDCSVENLVWRPRWYAVYYNNQFKNRYDNPIEMPIREIETGEIFNNSLEAGCRFGILEREVVLSIVNRTYALPTYQKFEVLD